MKKITHYTLLFVFLFFHYALIIAFFDFNFNLGSKVSHLSYNYIKNLDVFISLGMPVVFSVFSGGMIFHFIPNRVRFLVKNAIILLFISSILFMTIILLPTVSKYIMNYYIEVFYYGDRMTGEDGVMQVMGFITSSILLCVLIGWVSISLFYILKIKFKRCKNN